MQVFKNNVSLEATPASDTHIVNKAYLEDRISKINVQHAVKVDELPICTDNGDGTYTVTYVKDGSTETTTDTSQWFYYLDDNGNLKQTIFLEGEELTIDGAEIALDDYVGKEAFENTISELETNFRDGVEGIYNACVEVGSTPDDKTPTSIIEAIKKLSKKDEKWRLWVQAGGIYDEVFTSINDVLADSVTLDTLMRKHASVDFLVNWLESDITVLNTIASEESAMQYIGTYDYCADKMLTSNVISPKLLESDYWQYILKDHVPTLSANTSDVIYSSYNTDGRYGWNAFDTDINSYWTTQNQNDDGYVGYKFSSPICIKRITGVWYHTGIKQIAIQGSNNNTSWETISTFSVNPAHKDEFSFDISNNIYYTYYRVYVSNKNFWGGFITLNFHGRSLNVSVPTMTGNTAPEGECFGSTGYGGTTDKHYRAFDKSTTTHWSPGQGAIPFLIGYDFKKDVIVKYVSISNRAATPTHSPKAFDVQAYDSKNAKWITLLTSSNSDTSTNGVKNCVINNNNAYQRYRVYITSTNSTDGYCNIGEIQFYGVDYSE